MGLTMPLVHYEVKFHLVDTPSRTKVIRLLTSEDPKSVEDYLVREYGSGMVVLHYAELEKATKTVTKTCGYCGCSREEPVRGDGRSFHPAELDKSLWRVLV